MGFGRQLALTGNTVRILLVDPFVLILNLTLGVLIVLTPRLPGFAFGEQVLLVREQSLALIWVAGMILLVIAAGRVLSDDFLNERASMIFSNPVSVRSYLFARWIGIGMTLAMTLGVGVLSAMVAVRMAFYEFRAESLGAWVWAGSVLGALVLAVSVQFLFRAKFTLWANGGMVVFLAVGMTALSIFGYEGTAEMDRFQLVDGRIAVAAVFLFAGLMSMAAMLITVAVMFRPTFLPVFGIGLFLAGVFLPTYVAGLPNDFLRHGIAVFLPDWHLYWIIGQLSETESETKIASRAWLNFFTFKTIFWPLLFACGQSALFLNLAALRPRWR